mmetsp:Transcript_25528/g.64364  ORF Transcript_25528/g.64364 Transcript_25528/m.64364 type:complete len:177 (-) Transcript_25528:200-730(-)
MSDIQWDGKFVLAQTTVMGGVMVGGACTMFCHFWKAVALWGGVQNPRMFLEVVPVLGCGGSCLVWMRARQWFKDTLRDMARGTQDEEERMSLRSDALASTALQTMAAGAGGSLFLHLLTLVSNDPKYGLAYDVALFSLGAAWLAMSFICRAVYFGDESEAYGGRENQPRGKKRKFE